MSTTATADADVFAVSYSTINASSIVEVFPTLEEAKSFFQRCCTDTEHTVLYSQCTDLGDSVALGCPIESYTGEEYMEHVFNLAQERASNIESGSHTYSIEGQEVSCPDTTDVKIKLCDGQMVRHHTLTFRNSVGATPEFRKAELDRALNYVRAGWMLD